ncbi:2Fe-2S iron-sulfur cluster-binding protein [Aquiflexum gelatinilyticum]|uniref:(2Fe-2S)-binding protein n=1 Tax=Aquiflexum gelatinilyticum TaxID=2961943 RepID=A0A9X2SYB3_9BACT|nr:(2Fe-2S)-binding protein [Aquiflexum gelatinilyticum]MCR9015122.1 (2Fe-2S)-binding protein [Aquiflexum gelatinilyticum]MCS4433941.1 (2Fe-2S)-binding protein [Aquiflexum gelatinilyticum]
MLKIVIQNLFQKEIISPIEERKVIDLIHENRIDWMHACGKKGRCTTCKIIVHEGMENLSPLTEREEFFMGIGRLKSHERLSCQAKLIKGEILVSVAEENKFPHMDYSE